MASFDGFPGGKVNFTRIPGPFFKELLPQIDDLNELKVTLYALWQLERMEGELRYLQPQDFSEDALFMGGLAAEGASALETLDSALAAAVKRGTLLQAELELSGEERRFFFLNTPRGQAAVKSIGDGAWQPSGDERFPIDLAQERPNIFALYEQHIGPLTPMLAEALDDAEKDYSAAWIEDAFRIAVENNARKWSYVQAILRRWQEEGRDEGRHQGSTEKDRRKYVEGEFSDFIEH